MTTTTVNEKIAAQIVGWRNAMSYSQRDAAEALGCSRDAFGGWERGTQECPLYIRLAMSALALGVKPLGADQQK